MDFELASAITLLKSTPQTLEALLGALPGDWLHATGNEDSWSPFDVVGHFIHGEKTDWIPRVRIIMEHGDARPFEPFDRFAQFEASRGKTLRDLLDEFATLRQDNIAALEAMNLQSADLARKGCHPELGEVTLGQLIATWVVHDLDHLQQIVRTLANQYTSEVGPWREYLTILDG